MGAVGSAIGATAIFALILVLIGGRAPVIRHLLELGPIAVSILWLRSSWLERLGHSPVEQVAMFAALVVGTGFLLSPFAAFAWDVSPRLVLGTALTCVLVVAAFTARAVMLPFAYLEPIDLLFVPGVLFVAGTVAAAAFGLSVGFAIVVLASTPLGVIALTEVNQAVGLMKPRDQIRAAQSLFLTAISLIADILMACLLALS